jgi:hypothetical protein
MSSAAVLFVGGISLCRLLDRIQPVAKFATEPAKITIAGIELLHRIRKNQFNLGKLLKHAKTATAIWNAVLTA